MQNGVPQGQGFAGLPTPKSMDFRRSIDDLAALIELDIKVAVFDPVLFVFLKRARCFTS
ncbi:hypothetical protein D3C77_803960 [compost metagenome]